LEKTICTRKGENNKILAKLLLLKLNLISGNGLVLYIFSRHFCPLYFFTSFSSFWSICTWIFKIQIYDFISIWACSVQICCPSLMFSYKF